MDRIQIQIEEAEEMRQRLKALTLEMGNRVEADALRTLGGQALSIIRAKGPRSAIHRGPGRSRREKWRSPTVHAIDTIKVSAVRKDNQGRRYILVGPQRGDNSPSFYLKFPEYGYYLRPRGGGSGRLMPARPFLRPAQAAVSTQRNIAQALREAMDRRQKT